MNGVHFAGIYHIERLEKNGAPVKTHQEKAELIDEFAGGQSDPQGVALANVGVMPFNAKPRPDGELDLSKATHLVFTNDQYGQDWDWFQTHMEAEKHMLTGGNAGDDINWDTARHHESMRARIVKDVRPAVLRQEKDKSFKIDELA